MTHARAAPRRAMALAAALLFLASACGRGDAGSRDDAAPGSAAPSSSSDGGIAVRVERRGERDLVVSGTADAGETVQVSVEDGESVLYGPADVPVRQGRFRVDVAHEPTTRPRVFVYVADPRGLSQTVVALDRASTEATAGPAR